MKSIALNANLCTIAQVWFPTIIGTILRVDTEQR
jgi:hypothetical protein